MNGRSQLSLSLVLAFAEALAAAGRDLPIVGDGRAHACVVVSPAAPFEVQYAAGELRDLIERQTGVTLTLSAAVSGERAIRLEATDLGAHDWFRLQARTNGDVVVSGNARGVLFGVYELLRRFGGCEWYAPDTEVVPRLKSFSVPTDLDVTERAAFLLRDSSWFEFMKYPRYALRRRLNGPRALREDARFRPACKVNWPLSLCHTFQRLMPRDLYASTHPEYFAYNGSRRVVEGNPNQTMQLCLTNPDVLAIVTSNVLETIRRNPACDVYGVSQNDNQNYCRCAACAAVDAEEGSHAGTVIRFVNRVAEAVEREFPGKLVETLAYQYSRPAPRKTRPRDNVLVCLCSLECDFSKPIPESRFAENAAFARDLRDWREIAKNLYLWDYTANFHGYMTIHPNLDAIAGNLRFYHDSGVTHIFEQGAWHSLHAWFSALKAYVISELEWRPDQPLKSIVDRFFDGYYGAAAPFVRTYYEAACAFPRDEAVEPLTFNVTDVVRTNMPAAFFERGAELFARAKAAVADDPVRLRNVEGTSFANDYTRAAMAAQDAAGIFVSRHPERLDRDHLKKMKVLAKDVLARVEDPRRPGYVAIAEESRHVLPRLEDLRRLASFEIPTASCDRAVLEDRLFRAPTGGLGSFVDDPRAADGRALRIRAENGHNWISGMSLDSLRTDPDGLYTIRLRARVELREKGRSGDVFSAGVWNEKSRKAAFADFVVRTDALADGYAWYELPAWRPKPGDRVWFAAGKYDRKNGETPMADVYIDAIDIVRKD